MLNLPKPDALNDSVQYINHPSHWVSFSNSYPYPYAHSSHSMLLLVMIDHKSYQTAKDTIPLCPLYRMFQALTVRPYPRAHVAMHHMQTCDPAVLVTRCQNTRAESHLAISSLVSCRKYGRRVAIGHLTLVSSVSRRSTALPAAVGALDGITIDTRNCGALQALCISRQRWRRCRGRSIVTREWRSR